ncbi:hypothetical protein [Vibrio sp. 10N.222.55.C7]|uniref:hypothetical protein n=1 Tax=Vibrio sp. 10N.222.55.C7 TaxID=3229650 RepID=UPI00354FA188
MSTLKQLWIEELDKLPSKNPKPDTRWSDHAKFLADKKEKEDNELQNKKAQEEIQKALRAQEEKRKAITARKLEDASIKLKKRTNAIQQRASEERKVRENNARRWIDKKKWEHIAWQHRKQDLATGKITWKEVGKEPIKPTAHWFTGDWYIKPQFKDHYD